MSSKRLDWDRAKWDAFRARAGSPSAHQEIDSTEEAKLQVWWDAKKTPAPASQQRIGKKKKHRLKYPALAASAKAKPTVKKSRSTHAERLAKWKAKRKSNPTGRATRK